jgi:hypothetical protein
MNEKDIVIKKAINLLGDNYHSKGRGEDRKTYSIDFTANVICVILNIGKPIGYKVIFNLWGAEPIVEKSELIERMEYTIL